MSTKIGGFTLAHLVSVSEEAVGKKTKDTVVLDSEAEARIPKFDNAGTLCFFFFFYKQQLCCRLPFDGPT